MIKVMGLTEQQCIREETEYRDWKKCPLWYCVKTLFNMNTGKMESEIVRDEKTKQLIAIQDTGKRLALRDNLLHIPQRICRSCEAGGGGNDIGKYSKPFPSFTSLIQLPPPGGFFFAGNRIGF